MKTSFVRPAEGELRAVGKLLHRTSTLAFCEASVFDDGGHLCAHATGTFKYLRALPGPKGVKVQRGNPPAKE
jgi:acyl-coenzyme A thioesterase PaaI-like protein